jgi:rod shape-determining protein MreC
MVFRTSSRFRFIALVAIPLAILVIAVFFKPVADPLTNVVTSVAAPAYAAGADIRRATSRLFSNDTENVDDLERQLDSLRTENAKLNELAVENETLKAALGYKDRDVGAPVTARVISETSDDVFHGIVIDRGASDGVKAGQPVIVGDGVIIGKIFETRDKTSSVLLLSDSKSRLAVSIQQTDGTVGALEGDGGLSMAINLIPQTVTVSSGDMVVTSGLEPGIRRGLVVGTVDVVTQHTQDPFQSATVVPFSEADHPVFVQVITDDTGAPTSGEAAP